MLLNIFFDISIYGFALCYANFHITLLLRYYFKTVKSPLNITSTPSRNSTSADQTKTPLLSFDSTTLLVNPLTVDLIHENYNLCPGDSLSLDISTLGVTYEWNDGSTNPLITIVESGTYSVTATSGCDQVIDSIIVTENSKFLNLGQDITIDLGDSIRLDVISSGFENPEYLWTDPLMNSLNCIDCEEPTARPFDDVTYTLTVTEPSGCSASDDIQVTVLKNRDIYAPNVFSPNADGLNDRFYLQAKNEILIKTLRIYNRWGAVVFEQEENVWTCLLYTSDAADE